MDPSRLETLQPLRISGGQRGGSNLAAALILLPCERRNDAFLFYDFCKTVDDISDEGDSSPHARLQELHQWIHALRPDSGEKLPAGFSEMIGWRQLDRSLLSDSVRGLMRDSPHDEAGIRYSTFDDLRLYCWRVASAVGLLSASLFGARGESVERYAETLGIALQLTNILRDVSVDARQNRIYIPLEDLERFGVSEAEVLEARDSPMMTHLLNHQAERADSYFAKAEIAWSEMTANQRRLMRPARLMSAIYRDLLLQMHQDRYDVFAKRYRVSGLKKLVLLLRVMSVKN
jgi:phytoene synthase